MGIGVGVVLMLVLALILSFILQREIPVVTIPVREGTCLHFITAWLVLPSRRGDLPVQDHQKKASRALLYCIHILIVTYLATNTNRK
jgi:hypothetical protein